MRYRKLRIAWSVFWGLAAVLLIVLWVPSYWWNDSITWFNPHFQGIASEYGGLVFIASEGYWSNRQTLKFNTEPIGDPEYRAWWDGQQISHWFPATLFLIIAAVPWIPRRFSLRTLLIATTLVAVVLGLIGYVTQQ